MLNIKKLLSDQFIPLIILFSIIIALILTSKVSLVKNNTSVLGLSDPPAINCKTDKCGFCKNCGGTSGISCGQLSRCVSKNNKFICQFDINCF